MHAEWGHVTPQAVAEIEQTRAAGGRIIPVGTTALRLIETAARGGSLRPFEGDTDIFIYPGFEFQITDGLMTNFHLPKSTLLMLVAALMGKPQFGCDLRSCSGEKLSLFQLRRCIIASCVIMSFG